MNQGSHPPPGPYGAWPQQQQGAWPQQQQGAWPQQQQQGAWPQQQQGAWPQQQQGAWPQQQQQGAWPQQQQPPAANPYSPPAGSWAADPPAQSAFGDAAGEHLRMKRGRFSAWPYVVLAFIAEMIIVGLIPGAILGFIAEAAGAPPEASALTVFGAAIVLGVPLAYLVFRDRWRCIEAFSSRFCVGLMNISILFVPAIALVYANVRGFQKLAGK